jgi:glycosyltransferase involved in cell wall biosynthesis
MRILIIAGFFAPYAPTAGVRPGKLAKYLLARGHDVRVIAARNLQFPPLLPREVPEEKVVYARCPDVNAPPRYLARMLNSLRSSGKSAPSAARSDEPANVGGAASDGSPGTWRQRLRALSNVYADVTNWPDARIGWLPFAVSAGSSLLKSWRADLIYVSVPPHTGFLVAKRLSERFAIPWIAEYRDLWTDHPYYTAPAWRERWERPQEDTIIRTAAGLVTVSDVWRDVLRDRFGKPAITVLNGFDPDDYPADPAATSDDPDRLEILYTGSLYPGRRDPTALFAAIGRMGAVGAGVHVSFYGADVEMVSQMARRAGIPDQVSVRAAIPYRDVVALQRAADVLLLLRWSDPSELGVVPGKLFEYVGARRPILCVGRADGTVPEIIKARGLGLVSEEPQVIAGQLGEWLKTKKVNGRLPPLPIECRTGLSRADQFEELEEFLSKIAGPAPKIGQIGSFG